MKYRLFIYFLAITCCTHAQVDNDDPYVRLGLQVGLLLNPSNDLQPLMVDAYVSNRFHSLGILAGFGLHLGSNSRLEIGGSVNGMRLYRKAYLKEVNERLAEGVLQHDFELDETNSTGAGLIDYNAAVDYLYDLHFEKWNLSPFIGFGIRKIGHRDYQFALRESNSNLFTQYALDNQTKLNYYYRCGARFQLKAWPAREVYFAIAGGQVNYDYQISGTDYFGNETTSNVKFSKHLLSFSLGVSLKIPTTDFKKSK